MLAKPKRDTTHWKTLPTFISIHNLCGFSIHSKCIGTVPSFSSEDNAPLFLVFFLLHLFFKSWCILESALYQRCMELLNLCCVIFHNTFFIFHFYLKKKLFRNISGAVSVVNFS